MQQVHLPMNAAADTIRRLAHALAPSSPPSPRIIGITGPVGAGKSTLAAQLSPCIIATDHYLPDYDRVPEHRRDLPEESDLARLLADLRVFIDAPRDIRWKRWEHLETSGQRGWGVEVARAFFNNVAEPTFHARAAAYRATAHIIVINDAPVA